MIVRIDQSGHDHPAVQIDHFRLLADVAAGALIVANINDTPCLDGNRLLNTVLMVDGVNEAVLKYQVRGRRPVHCIGATRGAQAKRRGGKSHPRSDESSSLHDRTLSLTDRA
jgi:hypothetical protein